MGAIKGWYSIAFCVQGQKSIKTHNLSVIGMTSEHHCLAAMFELHCETHVSLVLIAKLITVVTRKGSNSVQKDLK